MTSLRFYAALAVFLYHCPKVGIRWSPLNDFIVGHVGVPFFFVLSGFVLTWSFRPGMRARTFWWRRFARIYPSYLATTLIAAVLIGTGVVGGSFQPHVLLMHMGLVQTWSLQYSVTFGLNSVAWTLSVEAFFYLTFPLLAWLLARVSRRTRWLTVLACLTLSALATHAIVVGFEGRYYAVNPLLELGQFMLGILLALELKDGWRPQVAGSLVAASAIPLIIAAKFTPQYFAHYLLLPAFAAIIVLAAGSDAAGHRSFLNARLSVYLGEVSYAFYLVHVLVLWLLVTHLDFARPWSLKRGLVVVAIAFTVTLVAAMALHHGVERPFQRWLLRKPARPEPAAVPAEPVVGEVVTVPAGRPDRVT